MKIKDILAGVLALFGFSICNGAANDDKWSIWWCVAGLALLFIAILIFGIGRDDYD